MLKSRSKSKLNVEFNLTLIKEDNNEYYLSSPSKQSQDITPPL